MVFDRPCLRPGCPGRLYRTPVLEPFNVWTCDTCHTSWPDQTAVSDGRPLYDRS
jgi:hypothetical protein